MEPRLTVDMSLLPAYGALTATWSAEPSAASYTLARADALGNWTSVEALADYQSSGSYTDSAITLSSGSVYRYGILDDQGNVLDTATLVTASQLSGSSCQNAVTLNWTNNDPSLSFDVLRADPATVGPNPGNLNSGYDVAQVGNASTYTDSGLAFDATYLYQVLDTGNQLYSNQTTVVTAPTAPGSLSADASSAGGLSVQVQNATAIDAGVTIDLYRGDTADFLTDAAHRIATDLPSFAETGSGSVTHYYNDVSLPQNTTYYYKALNVSATTGLASLAASGSGHTFSGPAITALPIHATANAPFSGVVARFVPSAPGGPSDFAASIEWGDGSTDTAASAHPVTIAANADGSFSVSGAHTFSAAASPANARIVVAHVPSGYSDEGYAAVSIATPAPTGLSATSTGNLVNLSWSGPAPLYEISRWQGTGAPTQVGTTTDNAFQDADGLAPDQNYFYAVTADYGSGLTTPADLAASTSTLSLTAGSADVTPSTGGEGGSVLLHAVTNDLSTLAGSQLSIDWGDGTTSDLTTDAAHLGTYSTGDATTQGLSAAHDYAQGGTFTPALTVTDAAGASRTALFGVTQAGANPTITAAAAASDQTPTSADLSVAASGTGDLTYTWSVVSEPDNAADPTFSDNADATASAATATFYQAGTYELQVTASNRYGGLATTSDVSVTFDQQLASLSAWPAAVSVPAGGSYQLHATGLDQFGHAMATQPTIGWYNADTVHGSLGSDGLYTADSDASGTDAATATATGVNGSVFSSVPIAFTEAADQPTSAPASATAVTATANADGSVTINWTPGDGAADGFLIEASNDGGSTYAALGIGAATDTSFAATDASLIGNANYLFRITAYNAAGSAAGAASGSVLTAISYGSSAPGASPASGGGSSVKVVHSSAHATPVPPSAHVFAALYNQASMTWGIPAPTSGATYTYSILRYRQSSLTAAPPTLGVTQPDAVFTTGAIASTLFGAYSDNTVSANTVYYYFVQTVATTTSTGAKSYSTPVPVQPGNFKTQAAPANPQTPTVTNLKVRTYGGTATSEPTGQTITWSWSGPSAPTWVIIRSDGTLVVNNQTITPTGGTQTNGSWTWIDHSAPLSQTGNPGIWYYTVSAVVASSGPSHASLNAFAPQVFMLLGSGNFDGTPIQESFDATTTYEMHWFLWTDSIGAQTAIGALPTGAPVVLAGISFGGGEAAGLTYQLTRVDRLLLFDPVSPSLVSAGVALPAGAFPYYVGATDANNVFYPDHQSTDPATIPSSQYPHSTFTVSLSVIEGLDWYQTFDKEWAAAKSAKPSAGTWAAPATGAIINPVTPGHTWANNGNVGTGHTSQIDPSHFGIFTDEIFNAPSGGPVPALKAEIDTLNWLV